MEKLNRRYSKAFHCIKELFEHEMITQEEKGYLKDLIFLEDSGLVEALLIYELGKNFEELKENFLDLIPEKIFTRKFLLKVDTKSFTRASSASSEEGFSPSSTESWTPKSIYSQSPRHRSLKRPSSINVPLNRQLSYYQQF